MENVGPFNLESVLGRGGMGTVYRARHRETNEVVAVKILAPAFSADDHFRNRFESEIKTLLQLNHPNIVRLLSYGQYDHNLYFAMELVEGKSLFQLQKDGVSFHWRDVIGIAQDIVLGLRHAHDRGIIHRDLKPGNLLKSMSGEIKITDFGIAKSFGVSHNTGSAVLGTVDFMSPEQASGQPVTSRSDLYSLGAVMYTLLGGTPPLCGDSVEQSLRNLTTVPAPRISRLAPDVPQPLDDLIAQLLQKAPDDRPQTALALSHSLNQLEQQLKNHSEAKTAERPQHSHSEKTAVLTEAGTNAQQKSENQGAAKTVLNESDSELIDIPSGVTRADVAPPTVSDNASSLNKAGAAGQDFFTNVSSEQREPITSSTPAAAESQSNFGKLALAAALLMVLCLAGFGVYQALRTPSAEDLLVEIEEEWEKPHRRTEAIQTFIANYPDHPSFDLVKQRQRLAKAYHILVGLRNKKRRSLELSPLQIRFVEIMNRPTDDLSANAKDLEALVTLYGAESQDLTDRDQKCLSAVAAYLELVQEQAVQQRQTIRDNIQYQFALAEKMKPQQAIESYQSMVQLNSKYAWAEDLVALAKQKIKDLKEGSKSTSPPQGKQIP